jgi:hypothetical protein
MEFDLEPFTEVTRGWARSGGILSRTFLGNTVLATTVVYNYSTWGPAGGRDEVREREREGGRGRERGCVRRVACVSVIDSALRVSTAHSTISIMPSEMGPVALTLPRLSVPVDDLSCPICHKVFT